VSLLLGNRGKDAGKLEADGGAAAFACALSRGVAAMLAGDGAHEIKTETGAFGAEHVAIGDAIEAEKDALEVGGRNADALVGDTDAHPRIVGDFELNANACAV